MARARQITDLDPEVFVHSGRLEWAFRRWQRRTGGTQESLAAEVVRRWSVYTPRQVRSTPPPKTNGSSINHWRTGKRSRCRASVLDQLAHVLEVPREFLRDATDSDSITETVEIPGIGRVRLTRNWSGWLGTIEQGQVVGDWASTEIDELARALAERWCSLSWWREVLLAEYDPEEELDDEPGGSLDFFDHMVAALGIALAPIGRDSSATLSKQGVGALSEIKRADA